MNTVRCDLAVIGGGIVGLATVLALTERHPGLDIVLLEKEDAVARHQTGRNSGVVHSGIYYRPGSLKARLCTNGARRLESFCRAHDLPYDTCGKVIVATSEAERPRLEALYERGLENGVPGLRLIGPDELRELEPHAAGLQAIHSPHTAIVDYAAISRTMAAIVADRGVRIETGAPATAIRGDAAGLRISTPRLELQAGYLINCAGLYSDRVARSSGARPRVRIIPFRGEYYMLKPERRELVRGLIYPVPDPGLPFLGVHLTRTVGGEVEAGPNAVLALAREGYRHGDIKPVELYDILSYAGFRRLARRYWRSGLFEVYRSLSKRAFVTSLQKLLPPVTGEDLTRGHAGVRAQAVDEDGRLIDDFVFEETERALHVLNAPSPAATASLAIGEHIAQKTANWLPDIRTT